LQRLDLAFGEVGHLAEGVGVAVFGGRPFGPVLLVEATY
jgi:hypothetical protein